MTLVIPTGIRIQTSSFGLRFNSQLFESPLNGFVQRVSLPGAKWFATYNLTPHTRAEAAVIRSFLAQLRGRANTFYGYDPDAVLSGMGGGAPQVNGGGQSGNSLVMDGAPTSITGWLKAGDYFEVNGEYKLVTADVNTNGSGQATISFEPSLRYSPADNASINITTPRCKMILTDDDAAQWRTSEGGIYSIAFSGMEALS